MHDAGVLVLARPRPTDVVSTLNGFAISTFDVDAVALARLLPASLVPDVVTLSDGRERALVSAVTFRNVDFHVGFAPFVRLVAEQTNFRAYVRRGEERAVWFFGTSLASRFVLLPRHVWRLPWAYARNESSFDFDPEGHCRAYRWHTTSGHGEERLVAQGERAPMGALDGFADVESTRQVLTHPLVGYLRRRDGRYATYGVDHPPLEMERARASYARFELFERLGLVGPDQEPHSVLVQRTIDFVVRLPPRTLTL